MLRMQVSAKRFLGLSKTIAYAWALPSLLPTFSRTFCRHLVFLSELAGFDDWSSGEEYEESVLLSSNSWGS